ncbi:unnamed protein product, partial [marine sediment metagenome]
LWDYSYYWNRSGIGARIEEQIAELQEVANLMVNAQAKLIILNTETGESATAQAVKVEKLDVRLGVLLEELTSELSDLRTQDEITWNQLMYGAEAHILILEEVITIQSENILALQEEVRLLTDSGNSMSEQLAQSQMDQAYMVSYIDYLRIMGTYGFWIGGACILLLLCLTVWALTKKHHFDV